MNDTACQSCHQRVYESFSTDHPDFGHWPYERRTRIAFNHASHRAKHFVEKKRSFDCRSCHLEDETRGKQLLASYEAACSSCHNEKIATSIAQGVPIVLLPTLDIDALRAAGNDVGAWPDAATGDFDGRLPPVMKLLLAGDPDAAKAIEALGYNFEFFDIDPDDAEQLQACATLAATIKKLLAELSSSGLTSASERLRIALGQEVDDARLKLMFAGLPTDLIRAAADNWLPDVEVDSTPPMPNTDTPGSADAQKMKTNRMSTLQVGERVAFDPPGTWKRDDATISIRYTPTAHADPVLTSWLQLLAKTPDLEKRPLALAMFKELASATAPGLCASCHSVEPSNDRTLTVNWRAYDGTSKPRTFTKFSHGPHLLLSQLKDCTSCHVIDDTKSSAVAYANSNPHDFVSDFLPLTKQQCVQCHTARAAGEKCQQCHNYHVDEMETWRAE
jgi:hypothetical protein